MDTNHCITGGKLLNRYFISVCIIAFAYHFGMNSANSTFTIYLQHLGYEPSINGIIALPASLTAMSFRFVSAYTTDNVGRRFTIVGGLLLYAACLFSMGAVPVIGFIVVFRILQAAGFSAANTGSSAANIDVAPPHRVGLGSAIFFVMMTLSLLIVGLIMERFTKAGRFFAFYALAACVVLAGVIAAFLCNYEKNPDYQKMRAEEKSKAPLLRGLDRFFLRSAVPVALISMLQSFGFSSIGTYISLFGMRAGIPNFGQFFTVSAVVSLVLNLSSSRIIGRNRSLQALLPCYGVTALCLIWLSLSPSPAAYFSMAAAHGSMFGLCIPVLYGEAMRFAPATRRGAASGTLMLANDVGMGMGNAMWGIIITSFGFPAAYVGAAAFFLAACALAIKIFRQKKEVADYAH